MRQHQTSRNNNTFHFGAPDAARWLQLVGASSSRNAFLSLIDASHLIPTLTHSPTHYLPPPMSTTAPPPGQLPVPGHSSSSSSRRKDAFAALPAPMSPARLGGGGSGLHSSSPSPSPTTGNPSPSLSNRPALTVDVRDQRSISDKRLPSLPAGSTLSSPGRVPSVKPWALGAYDNKLVSTIAKHSSELTSRSRLHSPTCPLSHRCPQAV